MLAEIVERVRLELPRHIAEADSVRRQADSAGPVPSFAEALGSPGLAVIAEVKRRSPSRGDIADRLDPVTQAGRYALGGAAAVSVLTEPHYFRGSPEDLRAVAASVGIPVLRKDFVIHPVQVWQARAWGASAVLLIAAILDDDDLASLRIEAESLGMDALVEAHDESDVDRALASGARILGVNNRDLATFEVDLSVSERLAGRIPDTVIGVAESGIWTGEDASRMSRAGYQAVLVGEALVRSDDPAALIAELR